MPAMSPPCLACSWPTLEIMPWAHNYCLFDLYDVFPRRKELLLAAYHPSSSIQFNILSRSQGNMPRGRRREALPVPISPEVNTQIGLAVKELTCFVGERRCIG